MNKPYVKIYTDGSYLPKNKNGGCAAYVECGDHKEIFHYGEKGTTNNRMELMAVITGLERLMCSCKIDVYSDSQYVVNAINHGWLKNWMRNGWKNSDRKPVANVDLWKVFYQLIQLHDVTFHWVKGHADNEINNLVDEVAGKVSSNLKKYGYE